MNLRWPRLFRRLRRRARAVGWQDVPWIANLYTTEAISGDPETNWLAWVRARHVRETQSRALELGCGDGTSTMEIYRQGFATDIDAYNRDPEEIEEAIRTADSAGIDRLYFHVQSQPLPSLSREGYALVFTSHWLAHHKDPAPAVQALVDALKPQGLIVANEYVGPSEQRWPEERIALADRFLKALPPYLRRNAESGTLKQTVDRNAGGAFPIPEPMHRTPASDRILPLLRGAFDVVEERPYGGSLIGPILEGIAENFTTAREADWTYLRLLFTAERSLIEGGSLPSDHILFIGKKRS